ncbi:hypothetical protein INT47_006018 [Mucor saturninus]|uniref:Tyr recombinase domain-containing protein n=1 Tax=Mucor saturninus TaxID=64648 RepID=A0A8H7UM06_9FUNG|nr:hypothetical protein INT47_006018 [Mucor saturninus]
MLDEISQSVPMPSMEHVTGYITEVANGSSQDVYPDYTELDVAICVGITRSISVAFRQESALATGSMAPSPLIIPKQRHVDNPPTLNEESTAIINNPHRLQMQRRCYDGAQRRFLDWSIQHNRKVLEFVSAIDMVNYLAYGRVHHKWAYNTILQYKQAILKLYTKEQRALIANEDSYINFFAALKNEAVLSFDFPVINLQPAIDFVLGLGKNQSMNLLQLTQKLCFLLGITGFLRPSDIERIDDSKTMVTTESLRSVILAPKEKRAGRPIEKVVVISNHSSPLLCPVATYQTYKTHFLAEPPIIRQHARLPQFTYTALVRNTTDTNRCIGSERISKHIRSILSLATTTATTSSTSRKTIKARAVGSTRAILAGAKLEDILTQGSWASSSIFDTYYRLNRASATNFSNLIL